MKRLAVLIAILTASCERREEVCYECTKPAEHDIMVCDGAVGSILEPIQELTAIGYDCDKVQ